ncbi:hypothetical protein IAR55_002108 [Kwoniella newhampshirensis]|uniref:Methyltransferase type 11 domain-containing protein n=1 Tax=Kwoniella newhampshirensis TaxID=1651941 RepID=A0AAW0Z0N0_9TREE
MISSFTDHRCQELVSSPSPTSSAHSIIPPVPDPRAPSAIHDVDRFPHTRIQHSRSQSETIQTHRHRASSIHRHTEMRDTQHTHTHSGNHHIPSGLAVEHYHLVGRHHSHTQHNSKNVESAPSPPGTTSAGHSPVHHTSAVRQSPPSEHKDYTMKHRLTTQGGIDAQRHRVPSGGHSHNLRCSPDCAAADAPYHLLAAIIGQASVQDFRTSRVPRRRRTNITRTDGDISARPNIQTRRSSNNCGSSLTGSASMPFPNISGQGELKQLAFDKKLLMSTPPLPLVEHLPVPPAHGEFFDRAESHEQGPSSVDPHDDLESDQHVEISWSSSAPAIPILAAQGRRLSNASVASAASIDVSLSPPRSTFDHRDSITRGRFVHESSEPIAPSPRQFERGRSPSPQAPSATGHTGLKRHVTISGRPLMTSTNRPHSIEQLVGSSSDVAMYLGPELAATFKRRLQSEQRGNSKVSRRKEEAVSEAEWSFEVPLSEAMGEALKDYIDLLPERDQYQLAEYGCQKETPNPLLAETVKLLCLRSVGISKPRRLIGVTHQCRMDLDTRHLQHNLSLDVKSYRKVKAMPSPTILTTFSFADFAEAALPPASTDIGICAGELSKLHGTVAPRSLYSFTSQAEERAQLADRDMKSWLEARAREIKPGGLLVYSFALRTTPAVELFDHDAALIEAGDWHSPAASPYHISMSLPTSPRTSDDDHPAKAATTPLTEISSSPFGQGPPLPSPPITKGRMRRYRSDMWQAMSHALTPAIQRLVSLGEIRSHVAPMLVDVPCWPRTLPAVKSTLDKSLDWEVLIDRPPTGGVKTHDSSNDVESIGLGIKAIIDNSDDVYSVEEKNEWAQAGVRIHRLRHPAWKAFKGGKIDRATYARRVATYCHSVYEAHLRKVLREKGKMDISQSETTVQELFKILVEKCELGALDALQIDVGVVVLRRR